ncbi:MAG: ATP-binding protein [Tannerellaceae bacterium]|nr:ATP-binding protein [Tannerellaceae bacterium]
MSFRQIYNSLLFRLIPVVGLTACLTWVLLERYWVIGFYVACCWLFSIEMLRNLYRQNARKIAFMFDAIDNSDYTFQYATRERSSDDKLVSKSLNRITQILLQAKADATEREKYYELIMNSVNTGIIVLDDSGFVYQTNKEAMRLLGMNVFTHIRQLSRIDASLEKVVTNIQPGEKHQLSFFNERGTINLSVRASEMILREKHLRIIAINDINSELDEKEIDSWIRLTRVLTHEIMNSVTPIASLSETLLSIHPEVNDEIRSGLETISTTGKGLISFVDSYRKFTHIPSPAPALFFANGLLERMIRLTKHQNHFPLIDIRLHIEPDDLIIHADENLITQVILNLLKNAMQAIGGERTDGVVEINAFVNENEAVIIEISNNGPAIPPEEIEHIFVPFFTTKEGGSGIGLSVSRQIMRLSGGSISLKSLPNAKKTTFVLTFP